MVELRLLLLCDLHGVKFNTDSFCEKWQPNKILLETPNTGQSTMRRCENCYYMPELQRRINQLNYMDLINGKN